MVNSHIQIDFEKTDSKLMFPIEGHSDSISEKLATILVLREEILPMKDSGSKFSFDISCQEKRLIEQIRGMESASSTCGKCSERNSPEGAISIMEKDNRRARRNR